MAQQNGDSPNASLKPVYTFILKFLGLTVPAFLIFILSHEDHSIQQWLSTSFPVYHLAKIIMLGASEMLTILGYDAIVWFSSEIYHYSVFAIRILGGGTVFIGFSCLGIGIMWFFASVIIASNRHFFSKTIYILCGVLIIQLFNMLRISYLTWLMRNNENDVFPGLTFFGRIKIDHHDVFNYFIIFIVFIFILIWFENKKIRRVLK